MAKILDPERVFGAYLIRETKKGYIVDADFLSDDTNPFHSFHVPSDSFAPMVFYRRDARGTGLEVYFGSPRGDGSTYQLTPLTKSQMEFHFREDEKMEPKPEDVNGVKSGKYSRRVWPEAL